MFIHRSQSGKLQHARGSGGVVVGSMMDLSKLRRGKRVPISQAEMIVVRSDDDPFVFEPRVGAGYRGNDILDRLSRSNDFGSNVYASRQFKRLRLQIGVDLSLNCC